MQLVAKRFSLRDLVNLVHRWTGLVLAAFLVIVGITGSLLAVREHINRLFNPGLYVDANGSQPLDLATLAERAEAQEPKIRIWMFTIEERQVLFHVTPAHDPLTGKPVALDFDQLVLDPYTGRELGMGNQVARKFFARQLRSASCRRTLALATACALRLVERDVYHATGVSTGNAEGLWDTTI